MLILTRFTSSLAPHLLATVLLVACGSLLHAQDNKQDSNTLPQLGNTNTLPTSLEEEYHLGRKIVRQFRGGAPLVDDPIVTEHLNSLAYYILRHSEVEDRRITLLVFDLPVINAFAAPGGIVGLYSGMVAYMENEGQLASILAHEFAHLSQRHYARSVEYSASRTWRNLLLGLGSILVAARSSGDAGIAAIAASQASIYAEQLSFSRENEREADQIGSQTMLLAKYDPSYVAEAFELLNKSRGPSGGLPEYLQTHPLPSSRVTEARLRARQSTPLPPRNSLNFQIVKARIAVKSSSIQKKHDGLYANWREFSPSSHRYAAAYGRALVAAELGLASEAHKLIRWVRKKLPTTISVIYAEAEIELLLENPKGAAQLLEKALNHNPRNIPLLWLNAKVQKHNGDITAALRTLELIVHINPTHVHTWYQLAELYGLAGDITQVHKARAEFFYLTGRDRQALEHLGYALNLARHNFTESERIRERINTVKEDSGIDPRK